jgi:hypothetical protein
MKRSSNWGRAWSACLIALLAAVSVQAQVPTGKRRPVTVPATRPFSLFGSASGARSVLLSANRVYCPIWDFGSACFNPEPEGGYWPAGTWDNYVFNGGLQVGATVPSNAGFGWAGDTVGVFFMDPRGDQREGSTVTGLFDSRNANDLAVWPTTAYIRDTSLFNQSLIGRQAISDQDTWVRYWDGNPALTAGRRHMMGMVVDQRTLAWNRPFHQDMVYFIFRLINVTSRLPASYAGLAAAGYSAADQQQLAALDAQFQDSARGRDPTLQMPAAGFTFANLYTAYNQDPDIGHHVPVPFNAKIRASWGILTDSSFTNTTSAATPDGNNGLLTWADVASVDPAPAAFGACTGTPPAFLMDHARLSAVAFLGSTIAGVPGLTATGNGFIWLALPRCRGSGCGSRTRVRCSTPRRPPRPSWPRCTRCRIPTTTTAATRAWARSGSCGS